MEFYLSVPHFILGGVIGFIIGRVIFEVYLWWGDSKRDLKSREVEKRRLERELLRSKGWAASRKSKSPEIT